MRTVVTALRIVVAGTLTVMWSLAAIVVLLIVRRSRWFHTLARTWAQTMLRVFGIRLTVTGGEHIDRGAAYVFVANHASMFDIPACLAGIPADVHIMLKRELVRVPVWGWALALSPYIVIDRFRSRSASGTVQQAADAVRSGRSLLVFAEGTRTRTGDLLPFKRGAFAIAAQAGVPVSPVTINNTFRILRKGSLDVRPAPITLDIGPAIVAAEGEGKDREVWLLERTREAIGSAYISQS